MPKSTEKKAGDVLATADFHLTGKGCDGNPIDETVHAELYVSGAFQYGNQTGMSFKWNNGSVDSFDTRYEKVSVKNFKQFARKTLEDMVFYTVHVDEISKLKGA